MTALLLLSALALLAPAPDGPDDPNKKDLERLQGAWRVQKWTRAGEDHTDELAGGPVVFDGGQYTMTFSGKAQGGSFKLDAAKTPGAIDLLQSGPGGEPRPAHGVYRFDGDVLTIAVGLDGAPRRGEFASKPDSKVGLLVLKREKTESAADKPDDANKKDLDKLQGAWRTQQFKRGGDDDRAEDVAKMMLVFDGAKYAMKTGVKDEPGTFKLDAAKAPAAMDLTPDNDKNTTVRCIYQIDGDTLKIAFGLDGSERPGEFVSKPNSKTALMVLKREKK